MINLKHILRAAIVAALMSSTAQAAYMGSPPALVVNGGTGLTSGTSGGVLGFTASGTLASSVALTLHAITIGGGAGATPTPLASLGTSTTLLHGAAAGDPTFSAVSLTADVSGNLPNANLASQTANTVLGALTATTPSGLAVPSCSSASNALTWTSGTGFGCNTISGSGTVNSGTATHLAYYASSTTAVSNNAALTEDGTSHNVNYNTASITALASSFSGIHVNALDSASGGLQLDSFGTNSTVLMRRADGTGASPTGLVASDTIGNLGFRGYDSSAAYGTTNAAAIRCIAVETWTSSAHGSSCSIDVTTAGGLTVPRALTVESDGTLYLGTSTNVSTKNTGAGSLNIDGLGTFNLGANFVAGPISAATRVITAAGAITVTTADYVVCAKKTTGAATTVNLPASPGTGLQFIIKDCKGDAATNNITVTPNAGNIDGSASFVMNTNHQSIGVFYDGAQWEIF